MDYAVVVFDWANDRLVMDVAGRELFRDLYASYCAHTTARGGHIWSAKAVSRGLAKLGAIRMKGGGLRYIVGFRIAKLPEVPISVT